MPYSDANFQFRTQGSSVTFAQHNHRYVLRCDRNLRVNVVIDEPFPVTRGVAQGCVSLLSPLFFAVYVDDLLQEFRESGIDIDMAKYILNALAFADDLAMLAVDHCTAKKLLKILSMGWRELEVVQKRTSSFNIRGATTKILDEIKYLGFLLTKSGSWGKYTDMIFQRGRGALAQMWDFFPSDDIDFDLQLKTANSLVLSKISYGQANYKIPSV